MVGWRTSGEQWPFPGGSVPGGTVNSPGHLSDLSGRGRQPMHLDARIAAAYAVWMMLEQEGRQTLRCVCSEHW